MKEKRSSWGRSSILNRIINIYSSLGGDDLKRRNAYLEWGKFIYKTSQGLIENVRSSSHEKTLQSVYPQYAHAGTFEPVLRPRNILGKRVGFITSESAIKSIQLGSIGDDTQQETTIPASQHIQQGERSIALRAVRKELVDEFRKTPYTDRQVRKKIIARGHDRDRIALQMLNDQKEVRVNMGQLGENMARFVVLKPPNFQKEITAGSQRPIIFIGSISGDIEGDGMLPQEFVFDGRPVIQLAYPDSWMGDVTDAFGKAAKQSADFEPYTTFFEQATKDILQKKEVKQILGDVEEFDMVGYSTGAVMIAELLKRKDIQNRVVNAVLIAPIACVDQKNIKIGKMELPIPGPIIRDYVYNILHLGAYAKKNTANFRKINYTPDHRRRELRAYIALRKKVLSRYEWWNGDLKVKEGGHIVVISGNKDTITHSRKVVPEIVQKPGISVIEIPEANHTTPMIEPEKIIQELRAFFTKVSH